MELRVLRYFFADKYSGERYIKYDRRRVWSIKIWTVKYNLNELYWIGYLYRYFSYTYNMSSIQVYKIVKPKELRGLYLPYHTLDPSQAIERILGSKNLLLDEKKN